MRIGNIWVALGLILCLFPGLMRSQTIPIADGQMLTCSGLFTDTGGPGNSYGPNQNLTITLCPDGVSGHLTQLIFSRLDLGPGDQLCFYDGPDTDAPLLFCTDSLAAGQERFWVQASADNVAGCLTVVFSSDATGEGEGWEADINCVADCTIDGVLEDGQVTWCPTGSDNSRLQRIFTLIRGPACFYDGPDSTATLIRCVDSLTENDLLVIESSLNNPSGCLSMTFDQASYRSESYCISGCQDIIAVLDSTQPAVTPGPQPTIDVCPGERIFFFGSGEFPQNGQTYEHSNTNSEFRWDFGDGNFAFGRTVSHRYDESGGYTVQLTITDPFGCTNGNFITQQVRVAPPPEFSLAANAGEPVCTGTAIDLTAAIDDNPAGADLAIRPGTGSFLQNPRRLERVALPDGIGVGYESTLLVTDFAPGQTLQSVDDLQQICAELEHSWLRDLDISLIAPNGQTVQLFAHPGTRGEQLILGQPLDDGTLTPGEGFSYCWSASAPNPDWLTFLNQNALDTLPSGSYQPSDPLTNLIGTPLNGEWTLRIVDRFPNDNGYLFFWSLIFDDSLYPNVTTFSPAIVDGGWQDNAYVTGRSDSDLSAVATQAGQAYFGYEVTDEFGCTFDTTLRIPIQPFTDPECLDCEALYPELSPISACGNESVQLDATGTVPLDTIIPFTNNPQQRFGFANFPPDQPYENTILVSGILQDTLTDPVRQIGSVCVQIETDWVEDIALFLRAPDGRILELSTGNGGGGDNFAGTCFSPEANISITQGTAPFAGAFLPEGDWSELRGAPINGAWTLLASDAFDEEAFGRLVDWSISFHSINSVTYDWSGADGLSCTDCPTPVVTTDTDATYTVRTTDAYGCSRTRNVTVRVVPELPAPEVVCNQIGNDAFRFNWTRPPGINSFELTLTVNGVPRNLANPFTGTQLEIGNLSDGDSLALTVQPIVLDPDQYCRIQEGFTSCVFGSCLLDSRLVLVEDADCFGANNGQAEAEVVNGSPPYRYFLNNSSTPQGTPRFENLTPGPYFIVVQDATFCTDTLFFEIRQPDSLAANLFAERSISCFGAADGRINTQAEGGTGPYNYQWEMADNVPFIDGLTAGTYRLTLTDANGCVTIDAFDLRQPDSLELALPATEVSCFGGNDGQISPEIRGGTAPFAYSWDTGPTDSLRSDLTAGTYCLTLTDANGCVATRCATLDQPQPLRIDSFSIRSVDCFGRRTGQASVFVRGGNGPYEYLWEDDLAQIGITASNLPAGETGLRIIDFNRCVLDTSVFIPQPDSLVVALTAEAARCKNGNEGSARAEVAGGTGPYNYLWQDGQTTPVADRLSRGNYRITVTDQNGCRALETVFVDEPELLLTIEANQTEQGCYGQQENQAIAIARGGSGGNYMYRWSNGQTTRQATDLDSLTYTVSVTDGNGCTQTTDLSLTDLPDMVPNMIINAPSCFGFGDGAIGINFVEGRPNSELNNFRFVWNTGQVGPNIDNIVGDSTYTVTVTDTRGCTAIASRFVREPQQITFAVETTPTTCPGGDNGTALVTDITSDSRDLEYRWGAGTGNQTGISATGLRAGNYQVTVSDEFNCFATGVAVVGQPEPIQVDFTTIDNACFGDQQGQAAASVTGGTPGYMLEWSDGRTGPVIDQLAAGSYQLAVTDSLGCIQQATVRINHPPPIQVDLRTEDVTCFGERDGGIIAEVSGGAPPYTFSLDNQTYQGSPLLIGLEAGTYDVYVRDAGGCTLFERTVVRQPDQFVIDAGPSLRRIARGDTLQLEAEVFSPQGPVTYNWFASFGDNLSCLMCPDPQAYPDNSISYEVIGLDSVGCEASDRIQVIVEKTQFVVVPTGFTPNGDGQNDQLLIHGKEGTTIERFQIFDRWGELVYQREDFSINDPVGWDGQFRNEKAPIGRYIWYMEVRYPDQSEGVLRGQTSLIR